MSHVHRRWYICNNSVSITHTWAPQYTVITTSCELAALCLVQSSRLRHPFTISRGIPSLCSLDPMPLSFLVAHILQLEDPVPGHFIHTAAKVCLLSAGGLSSLPCGFSRWLLEHPHRWLASPRESIDKRGQGESCNIFCDLPWEITSFYFSANFISVVNSAIQTDLRDIVGWVPDHHDKQVTWILFPSACKSYVYMIWSLLSMQ